MKPVIGIIMRPSVSKSKLKIKYLYDDIKRAIIKSGGVPIGIDSEDILLYLDICKGIILPGGDDISLDDIKAISVIINNDIPLLGICLGMQEIGYYYDGNIKEVINHKNNLMHEVMIDKNSLLYKILKCEKTLVNSRHRFALTKTNLTISALSNDNTLEAIEDGSKRFLLGVEWHPENMYDFDINSRKIFDYFIKVCDDNTND